MKRSLAALVVLAGLLAGCSSAPASPSTTPAPPVSQAPVVISPSTAPSNPVTLGVLAPPLEGEGSEFRPLAEGAAIAAYRLGLAGYDVQLTTALDDGTSAGAQAAVSQLVSGGVSGIVVASAGPHLTDALAAASAAGIPVIMVYDQPTQPAPGLWSIAPTAGAIETGVTAALADMGASKPYVIGDVAVAAAVSSPLGDPATIAQDVIAALDDRRVDSVVISAPAATQAQLVAAIQGVLAGRQAPIILTPQAQTPAFAQALADAGTTGALLLSIGTATDDPAALNHGDAGDAVAAFLAAVRLAATDPTCRNIYGDASCGATASLADTASHDAVVAFVAAAQAADSTVPTDVAAALQGIQLSTADGLAGPALNFGSAAALPDNAVVVLYATSQDPGLRPAGANRLIYWFADNG